jgi:hypothetical protein
MKKSPLLVALVSVLAVFGFWGGAYWERNREIAFTALLWRAGGPSQTIAQDMDPFRHKMVRDLLARHLHNGMSRAQVISILGEPESEIRQENEIWYWLTQEYGWGIDPKTVQNLVVKFDPNGNVEKVTHQVSRRNR